MVPIERGGADAGADPEARCFRGAAAAGLVAGAPRLRLVLLGLLAAGAADDVESVRLDFLNEVADSSTGSFRLALTLEVLSLEGGLTVRVALPLPFLALVLPLALEPDPLPEPRLPAVEEPDGQSMATPFLSNLRGRLPKKPEQLDAPQAHFCIHHQITS